MPYTDLQIMNQIQFTVIEPPNNGSTWPSGFWTRAEVLGYLNQRQNRLLRDTAMQIGTAEVEFGQLDQTAPLPDDWIATVAAYWRGEDGRNRALGRADMFEADHGIVEWTIAPDTPKLYTDSDMPPSVLQVMPIPDVEGVVELQYVPMAAELDGNMEIFTVPDEFIPGVKYGALADMFGKVGRAHDPGRAEYCEGRYQLGVQIAQLLLKGWNAK